MTHLILLFTIFPYYTLIDNPFGLQPYCFITALIILFINYNKIKIDYKLIIVIISSICLLVITELTIEPSISDPRYNSYRSFYNYIAFSIFIPTYTYLYKNKEINLNSIRFFVLISMLIGVVQLTIYKDFLSILLPRVTGALEFGRGVNGTCPEPTFYGILGIYMYILGSLYSDIIIKLCSLIIIIVLSQSSVSILILSLYFIYVLMSNVSIKFILNNFSLILIISIILIILSYTINVEKFSNLRISYFLENIYQLNFDIFFTDESSRLRINGIIEPIHASFNNYLLPGLFTIPINVEGRILSGFGALIYELGLLCFPVLYCIIYSMRKNKHLLILVMGTLFSSTQLGLPLLSLVLVIAHQQSHEYKQA